AGRPVEDVVRARPELVDDGVSEGAGGRTEYHVAAAAGAAEVRSDDQVREPIAVDVPGGGDASAAVVIRSMAVDREAAGPRGDGGEIDRGSARPSENHVAAPRVQVDALIAQVRSDDEVPQPVAVDVPGGGGASAAVVTRSLSVDHEAAA